MIELKRQLRAFTIMMKYANVGKPKVWARFPKSINRKMPISSI